jgi:UDP-glucose 4-epimerase
MMEMVLKDFCHAYGMKGIALRYFNPIGADPKMRSGLQLKEPSLVLGKMINTVMGVQDVFEITGVDWPTRDGSGIRDYVHVWDLAQAHLKALVDFDGVFERAGNPEDQYMTINLGTGRGVTVKELVAAFEKVWGKPINKREAPPRPGDVAGAFASAERAHKLLKWEAQLSIEQCIADAIQWGEVRNKMLSFE